ncbi:MAG: hypothetical protein ACLFN0_08255 [Thermovirgaceae bacterium]
MKKENNLDFDIDRRLVFKHVSWAVLLLNKTGGAPLPVKKFYKFSFEKESPRNQWGRIFYLLIVFNLPDNRNRSEPKTEDQASLYFEKHGNDILRHGFNTLRDLAVRASGRHLVRVKWSMVTRGENNNNRQLQHLTENPAESVTSS